MPRLFYTLLLLAFLSASASAQTAVSAGVSNYALSAAGSWINYTFPIPTTYSSGAYDVVIIARANPFATTNPSDAEVDLYVTVSGSSLSYVSAGTGADAVMINSQLPVAGRVLATEGLALSGPLPVTVAGTASLNIGVYVRAGSSTVNTSLTITYATRIQYDWTQMYNSYSGSLGFDQVQMFEYAIPFPQPGPICTNGRVNCSEGHIGFFMTPSTVDSVRRGALLGTYPSISGNPSIIPLHPSTYDRSSDVSQPAFAGEMITSNDQFCYGTAPYDLGRCVWRMMVWAKYTALPSYTFRAQVIDIATTIDNVSGDHTLLTMDAPTTAPRAIAAAEMQVSNSHYHTLTQALLADCHGWAAAAAAVGSLPPLSSSLTHSFTNSLTHSSALSCPSACLSVCSTSCSMPPSPAPPTPSPVSPSTRAPTAPTWTSSCGRSRLPHWCIPTTTATRTRAHSI